MESRLCWLVDEIDYLLSAAATMDVPCTATAHFDKMLDMSTTTHAKVYEHLAPRNGWKKIN